MAKIIQEYETKYNVKDIVIFKKNGVLQVGSIEGYHFDCDTVWYNIRVSENTVYTWSNQGDIGEFDIVGVVDEIMARFCIPIICGKPIDIYN